MVAGRRPPATGGFNTPPDPRPAMFDDPDLEVAYRSGWAEYFPVECTVCGELAADPEAAGIHLRECHGVDV